MKIDTEDLWTDAQDLAEDLSEAGDDKAKIAVAVATFLDAIVPLDVLVPGPGGVALEAIDGPAFERVIDALVKAFRRDPERRAVRQAKRAARRAERAARRTRTQDI